MYKVVELDDVQIIEPQHVKDCTFVFKTSDARLVAIGTEDNACVFENCRFIVDHPVQLDTQKRGLVEGIGNLVFNNCSFENVHSRTYVVSSATVTKELFPILGFYDIAPKRTFVNCRFDHILTDHLIRHYKYLKLENCTISNARFKTLIYHSPDFSAHPMYLQSVEISRTIFTYYTSAFIDAVVEYIPKVTRDHWLLEDVTLRDCYIKGEQKLGLFSIKNLQYLDSYVREIWLPSDTAEMIKFDNTYVGRFV